MPFAFAQKCAQFLLNIMERMVHVWNTSMNAGLTKVNLVNLLALANLKVSQ